MGGRKLLGAACALLIAVLAAPGAAQAGALADTCKSANPLLRGPCRGVETLTAAVTAIATPSRIGDFESTWTAAALRRQSRLGDALPFVGAPWVSTHNSFNSIAEMGPALSAIDANQQLTIVDQLRIGVRSIELDVHWFLNGLRGPVVCHATGPHVGCSVEKALEPVLQPVRAWLDANPSEVLLIYLENKLDGATGEAAAVAALERTLGGRTYRPPAGPCTALPLSSLSRDAVRAAGAQVVLVSNGCGASSAWRSWVFDWRDRDEERPVGFQPFPACGPHLPGLDRLVRYYEDSTSVTANAALLGAATVDDGIPPATARNMADCGVDLIGFDQLVPSDGRLDAVVWSWAPNEPAAGDCAVLGAGGRWASRACDAPALPAACRAADGSWSLSAPVLAADAAAACAAAGATHATPRTGYEGSLLRAAAAGQSAWLSLRRGQPGF